MTVVGPMPNVLMILVVLRLIPPRQISSLRPRPLEPLEGLDEVEELRRWHRESNLLIIIVLPWILGDFSTRHRKDFIVLGVRRCKQDKAGPTGLVGKTLQSRASFTVYSVITCR